MKRNKAFLLAAAVLTAIAFAAPVQADVTIVNGSEVFNAGIGDYHEVSGNMDDSAPGQIMDVLGGQSSPLHDSPTASETRSNDMGDLWTTLDDGGLTTASILGFGFAINETGPTGSNTVVIDELDMWFERANDPDVHFSLNDDNITVTNYTQGQNTAEAIILVDLGFDFMAEYNEFSTEQFTISSDISNTSDGFELYFLSSAFSGGPVIPEPASLGLLGIGGLCLLRRKRRGA